MWILIHINVTRSIRKSGETIIRLESGEVHFCIKAPTDFGYRFLSCTVACTTQRVGTLEALDRVLNLCLCTSTVLSTALNVVAQNADSTSNKLTNDITMWVGLFK